MRRLVPLVLVAGAFALPSSASAAAICSSVGTTGTVLGTRTLNRRCVNNPLPRYICTDSNPGVAQAGLAIRVCTPAP